MNEFRKLSDSEWVNVVNAPEILAFGGGRAAEDAVAKAFELIEALLLAKNQPMLDELQSRLEPLEKDCEELIKERDEREDVINELLNQVLQDERKEWSSAYDFNDAVIDVECKMKSLEKDAARWRMIPAVAYDHQINLMALYRDIETAMQSANEGL